MAKKTSKSAQPKKKATPTKAATKTKTAAKPAPASSKKATSAKKTVAPASKGKSAAKPVAKSVASKPVVKAIAKPAAKNAGKAAVANKPAAKPVASKPVAKPVAKTAPAKPSNKKKELDLDSLDFEGSTGFESSNSKNEPFFYEPPKAFIKRPDLKEPTPFVGTDNRSRYSDAELMEFKALLTNKLEEAQRDYELLKSTLSHKDDHGTDDTSPTFKLLEDGSDVMSKEETAVLASRQEKYIQNLQNALVRIENKSYGICRITGRLIPKERLRVVPHATTSMEGKMQQYS